MTRAPRNPRRSASTRASRPDARQPQPEADALPGHQRVSDARRRAREDALKRAWDLPEPDQIWLYEELGRSLTDAVAPEPEIQRTVRRRAEAVEVIARAAEGLGLPHDEAPTRAAFDEASRRLELGWSAAQITRLFGLWRRAQAAYLGERVSESYAQRSRRRVLGRSQNREGYLESLRGWLRSEPSSLTRVDYDDFRTEYNDRLPEGARPLLTSAAIVVALQGSWDGVVAVARGQLTLDELRAQRLSADHARPGRPALVGVGYLATAAGLGVSKVKYRTGRPGFPVSVAKASGIRLWLKEDADAYAAGRSAPEREPGELDDQVLGMREIARLVHVGTESLPGLVVKQRWDLVPPPAGVASRRSYWWREDVEAWGAEDPQRLRPRTRMDRARSPAVRARRERVLAAAQANPRISRAELAEREAVRISVIARDLHALRSDGLLPERDRSRQRT